MISLMKSIGSQRRMSLRPPRAFPIDLLKKKHRGMSLRRPRAFPIDFLTAINRKSKENDPEASKGISY